MGVKKLGEITTEVFLQNALDVGNWEAGKLAKNKIRTAKIKAVVDTGAVMVLLPQELVELLGLRIVEKVTVRLANEENIILAKARTLSLTIGDRGMVTSCLVGPPGCEPLVGQLVMEELDLIPDPRSRTLTPRPESPFRPTLKMKEAGIRAFA